MTVLYQAYAAKHGSTVIAGVTELDYQTNPEVHTDVSIGSPFSQFVAIMSERPRIPVPTSAIHTLIGITGLLGATIDDTNGFELYFAELDANGVPKVGGTPAHRKLAFNRGVLIPRKITCSHRGFAMAEAEAVVYSQDGVAHPLVITEGATLPTLVRDNVKFSLGPVNFGGVNIECLQNIDIEFGNSGDAFGCNSEIYDTHFEQPGVKPAITLTGLSVDDFGDAGVPPLGKRILHANTKFFFRRRSADGLGYVADDQAVHIKGTANGVAIVESMKGTGTKRAEYRVKLYCDWDGTLAPVTFNTASIIT